jgi:hypothetical protein
MPNSRRKFLKAGVLAALFAAVPLETVLGQDWKERDGNPGDGSSPALQNNDPLATYTKAAFLSYLNSVFQLNTGFNVIAVTLLKVDDMPSAKGGECFSLLFRGGSGRALRQNTYNVDHPSLGRFALFLVPVGTDEHGAQGYLATVNRLSYKDALAPVPTRQTGSVQQRTTSTSTSSPATSTPSPTVIPATTPAPIKPKEKPGPSRKKKPSWKSNDDDDFEID